MQAVEDTLGWLSALDRWIPDGRSLFPLLDRVRVEREEEALGRLLENLDEDGLHRILRVRPDDLDEASLPAPIRLRIEQSIPALLAGLARVLEFRTANGRRTVRMFNKAKHMLQGVVFGGRDGTRAFELISGTPPERIGRVVATADNVRTLAAETIVMQAVPHGMLATVLMVHYEHRYVSPPWVVDALGLPAGWHDGPEVARLVRA